MQRLAVHKDTVHIKDDRRERFQASSRAPRAADDVEQFPGDLFLAQLVVGEGQLLSISIALSVAFFIATMRGLLAPADLSTAFVNLHLDKAGERRQHDLGRWLKIYLAKPGLGRRVGRGGSMGSNWRDRSGAAPRSTNWRVTEEHPVNRPGDVVLGDEAGDASVSPGSGSPEIGELREEVHVGAD